MRRNKKIGERNLTISRLDKIEDIKRNLEKIGERNLKKKEIEENWRKKSAEFFLNKEKVMKMKEELCQKRLFQNLLVPVFKRF